MKKRIFRLTVLLLTLAVFVLPLSCCDWWDEDTPRVKIYDGVEYSRDRKYNSGKGFRIEKEWFKVTGVKNDANEVCFILPKIDESEVTKFDWFDQDTVKKLYIPSGVKYDGWAMHYYNPNLTVYYAGPVVDLGTVFPYYAGITAAIDVYVPYGYYEKHLEQEKAIEKGIKILPANVEYKDSLFGMNYIDNVEYGGKITNVPPAKSRKGYLFTGWYTEEECINKWDFSKNTLPRQQLTDDGDVVFQQTTLYAGWKIV